MGAATAREVFETEIILRMAELYRSGPTGTFVDENGVVPR